GFASETLEKLGAHRPGLRFRTRAVEIRRALLFGPTQERIHEMPWLEGRARCVAAHAVKRITTRAASHRSRDASVDADILSVYIARVVREKKRHGLRDFLGAAVAAGGDRGANLFLLGIGVDEARQHVVHADAVRGFLVRVQLAEAAERGA